MRKKVVPLRSNHVFMWICRWKVVCQHVAEAEEEEAHHKYSPHISCVCAVRFFCASGNKMQPRENSTTDADDDDDVDDDSCCMVVLAGLVGK